MPFQLLANKMVSTAVAQSDTDRVRRARLAHVLHLDLQVQVASESDRVQRAVMSFRFALLVNVAALPPVDRRDGERIDRVAHDLVDAPAGALRREGWGGSLQRLGRWVYLHE